MYVPPSMRNGERSLWEVNEENADKIGSYSEHDEKIVISEAIIQGSAWVTERHTLSGFTEPMSFPEVFTFQISRSSREMTISRLSSTLANSLSSVGRCGRDMADRRKRARKGTHKCVPKMMVDNGVAVNILQSSMMKRLRKSTEDLIPIDIVASSFTRRLLIPRESYQSMNEVEMVKVNPKPIVAEVHATEAVYYYGWKVVNKELFRSTNIGRSLEKVIKSPSNEYYHEGKRPRVSAEGVP
ncbi:hypothetical protein ACH5RR_000926 [Cinchona calisaya]|uniref:Uncharacterized protein n=1 Tax=Cinchona calisaya TaxID=153742 RepID=A0ABD3B2I0_9GENT